MVCKQDRVNLTKFARGDLRSITASGIHNGSDRIGTHILAAGHSKTRPIRLGDLPGRKGFERADQLLPPDLFVYVGQHEAHADAAQEIVPRPRTKKMGPVTARPNSDGFACQARSVSP